MDQSTPLMHQDLSNGHHPPPPRERRPDEPGGGTSRGEHTPTAPTDPVQIRETDDQDVDGRLEHGVDPRRRRRTANDPKGTAHRTPRSAPQSSTHQTDRPPTPEAREGNQAPDDPPDRTGK